MYIHNYNDFLILEHSKSDPIPELTWNKKGKTAIFLLGIPGSGKSTFIKKFIIPKLKDYKIFDPDDLQQSLKRMGKKAYERTDVEVEQKKIDIKKALKKLSDKYNLDIILSDEEISEIITNNLFFVENDRILENRFLLFLESGNSDVIFDTTGNLIDKIKKYSDKARENGYKILFIKVKSSMEYAVKGNLLRGRTVQPDYQLSTIERSEELERDFLDLNPDSYYIYNRETNKILLAEDYWDNSSDVALHIIYQTYTNDIEKILDQGEQKIKEKLYNICKKLYNDNKISSLNRPLIDDIYNKMNLNNGKSEI